MAVIIKSWSKGGSDDDFSSDEDVVADAAADEEIGVCGHEERHKRPDVVAIDFPAVFDLSHEFWMGAVDVE